MVSGLSSAILEWKHCVSIIYFEPQPEHFVLDCSVCPAVDSYFVPFLFCSEEVVYSLLWLQNNIPLWSGCEYFTSALTRWVDSTKCSDTSTVLIVIVDVDVGNIVSGCTVVLFRTVSCVRSLLFMSSAAGIVFCNFLFHSRGLLVRVSWSGILQLNLVNPFLQVCWRFGIRNCCWWLE